MGRMQRTKGQAGAFAHNAHAPWLRGRGGKSLPPICVRPLSALCFIANPQLQGCK